MKKIIVLFGSALIFFNCSAQQKDQRNIDSFTKLTINGGFDVVVKRGDKESVTIDSKSNTKEILTEVNDGELKVYSKSNWNVENVKVTIIYKRITEIKNSGSSDIVCNDDISAKTFKVVVDGSGEITLNSVEADLLKATIAGSGDLTIKNIKAAEVKASIAGSGDLKLSGKTLSEDLSIAGSGDIHAFELQSDTSSTSVAGSGDIKVNVSKILKAVIIGSGDIVYKGDAKIEKMSIVGSGDIRQAE